MDFFQTHSSEQTEHRGQEQTTRPRVVRWQTLLGVFFGALVLLGLLACMIVYVFPQSSTAQSLGRWVPIPVVFTGPFDAISSRSFEKNVDSVKRFYDKNQATLHEAGIAMNFDGPDGERMLALKRKKILEKMIEDELVLKIAKKNGIHVTQADLTQNVDRMLQEYGSRDTVIENLEDSYGWTLDDFERIIVLPSLYSEELQRQFATEIDDNREAREKIESALAELKGGASFADVARKYSDGATAENGGELGWVATDAIVPELTAVVKDQPIRAPTDIIESSLGFHILLVEEQKKEGVNGSDSVRLSQILVRKPLFTDWLMEKEKRESVFVPLRGLFWQPETATLETTDTELKQFEEKLQQQPNSILF